jgi:NAD(P)-dependent dehydrogenase (short-subunit alcohol dehydrogenase family)
MLPERLDATIILMWDWGRPGVRRRSATVYAHVIRDQQLPEDLRGRRAVVTGAARGIGEAIAKWLIMAGADVTVVDKDQQSLKLAFGGEPCQIIEGDLASDDVTGLADDLTRPGPVELIVNNVGVSTRHGFLDIGLSEFDEVLQTNLRGPWFFTRRLVDAFLESQRLEARRRSHRHGSIVFISSLHDRFVAGQAHYSASKAAVAMLSRELAKQLAPHRIRVNAISPGWIRTAEDTTSREQMEKHARLWPRIPLGVAGVPADVARVAIFLLSDAWAGYITGQNIAVDGGLSLHSFVDD